MDNQSIKNTDPIQLQQMIIFLRAELAKYKNEINRLRDSDYYSLVLRLERENVQLTKRNKELSMDRMKMNRTVERNAKAYAEELQRKEHQRKKHISSIDALLKEIEHLRAENKRLLQTNQTTNDELLTMKKDLVTHDKRIIENLENQLSSYTKEMNEKITAILEAIQNNADNNVHDYLVKELAERNNEINRLSNELAEIKSENLALSSEGSNFKVKGLSHLDAKIQKILAQSIDFEEQLDIKIRLLDDLEQQLTQLALEISVDRSM
ncbi:hypothetical protein ACIQXI_18960 [Lysinibacillus sp. NPDC097195]|uniref:hypothetical protein n=1 Tax=Lysinibacillus sp. NPDC097195 TaxID=3364141 RepID=UPI0037F26C02